MRDFVFSDQLALFSGRRVAFLLIILGGLSLLSGLSTLIKPVEIQPQIAAQMIEQSKKDLKENRLPQVVSRCRLLVRSNPSEVEAWALLVEAWSRMGEKKLAREAVQVLLRLAPNHPLGSGAFKLELEKIENEKK